MRSSQSRDPLPADAQEQAQRKKEALAERVEKLSRVRILEAIRKKLPDVLSRQDLEMVALDYFRRLGHDNHRRFSKLYAWEEKKSKTSWGAETVDYEKIAAAAVQAMKATDVNRFLIVCALISDLYCPGYNPRQPLARDSNLARTAGRYKLDTAKTTTAVREELAKSRNPRRTKPNIPFAWNYCFLRLLPTLGVLSELQLSPLMMQGHCAVVHV